jgi:hypothetical protein
MLPEDLDWNDIKKVKTAYIELSSKKLTWKFFGRIIGELDYAALFVIDVDDDFRFSLTTYLPGMRDFDFSFDTIDEAKQYAEHILRDWLRASFIANVKNG